jgi:hypothetical protein
VIGIHGARGTGKTCYLACLYGSRATEAAAVTFGNDSSIDYLKGLWATLRGGDVPDATSLTTPTDLHLDLTADGQAWGVTTRDYAGAIVQRNEMGAAVLREEFKDWVGACEAILLFLNIDATADDLRERLNEVNLLVKHLKDLTADGNTIARPLAILLTQWDRQGTPGHDLAVERQRAWQYLASHDVLKQIAHTLKICGDRVELFPVSAFGANRDGSKPPADGPKPVGLLDPLVWAAAQSDDMLFERARRKAEEYGQAGRCGKSVREFRHLMGWHGVNKGPVAEKARVELDAWTAERDRRRRGWATWGGGVLAAVVLLALGWLYADGRDRETRESAEFAALDAYRQQHPGDESAAEAARLAAEFRERWPGGRTTATAQKWEREDRARAEAFPANQAFAALDAYRQQHPEDESAAERGEKATAFCANWPKSAHVPQAQSWADADRTLAKGYEAKRELSVAYDKLQADLTHPGDDFTHKVTACDIFLERFRSSKVATAKVQEVERRRAEFLDRIDTREWEAVENYATQNPKSYVDVIDRASRYAQKPGARHAKQAADLADHTRVRWDRDEYEAVRKMVREAGDKDGIEIAVKAARRYLDGRQPVKRRAEAVKRYVDWFEGFQEEQEYRFTIRSVHIPQGSELDHGNNKTRVLVRNGDWTGDTGWGFEGNAPAIDKEFGVRFQWGRPATLEFTVEKDDFFGLLNPKQPVTIENESFLLGRLNGTLKAACKKGKDVELRLECPAAVPPALDAYPEK